MAREITHIPDNWLFRGNVMNNLEQLLWYDPGWKWPETAVKQIENQAAATMAVPHNMLDMPDNMTYASAALQQFTPPEQWGCYKQSVPTREGTKKYAKRGRPIEMLEWEIDRWLEGVLV